MLGRRGTEIALNVHSLVRTKTKLESERAGMSMIRPLPALERLTFLEQEGKVGYHLGQDGAGQETMSPDVQTSFRASI